MKAQTPSTLKINPKTESNTALGLLWKTRLMFNPIPPSNNMYANAKAAIYGAKVLTAPGSKIPKMGPKRASRKNQKEHIRQASFLKNVVTQETD